MLRNRVLLLLLGPSRGTLPTRSPTYAALTRRWNTRFLIGAMANGLKPVASPPPTRFELPGFGLPLNFVPCAEHTSQVYDSETRTWKDVLYPASGEGRDLFPSTLDDTSDDTQGPRQPLLTLREITMTRLMNEITEKVDWHIKVFDEAIVKKWKAEALASPNLDISEMMVDWCIEELRWKAKLSLFKDHGAVSIYEGDVIKSDFAIPQTLKEALQKAVAPLEDVPEDERDWHPGSNNQVLDLVHPSLFPVVYGKTKILPDSLTTLEDCVKRCGEGVTIPIPPDNETTEKQAGVLPEYRRSWEQDLFSQKFQWLPCDVDISGDKAKITSYINNLHPQKHPELYNLVEDVITYTIPLWNASLTPLRAEYWRWERIIFPGPQFHPLPEKTLPRQMKDEDDIDYKYRKQDWIREHRQVIQPEPGTFTPRTVHPHIQWRIEQDLLPSGELKPEKIVDLKRDHAHRGLQVIVKLANIHLTPESPSYPGGTWHVEGQRNERICASAIYYYDNDNITSNSLSFRQMSEESDFEVMSYDQDDHGWLKPIYGCRQDGNLLQEIGGIETKEGRIITFPNTLQHQVQPFTLADPTRPGHRKILALFLVDPNIRIISSANVPCQRRDWWEENVRAEGGEPKPHGDDGFPIMLEEARAFREELMEERKDFVVRHQRALQAFTISLCEH